MKVGILLSRVRVEEKWLLEALDHRGIQYDRIDDREAKFDITAPGVWSEYEVVLERCISFARGLYSTQILNAWGIPTVNMAHVAAACGDKLTTSSALAKANVPQPQIKIAFTQESALQCIEELGYPARCARLVQVRAVPRLQTIELRCNQLET